MNPPSYISNDLLPWVEKYRPTCLEDLVAHEDIVSILNTLIESNKLPHLLFYGPPGTGKTSTILACARKIYGESFKSMMLELNASDDRGLGVVREQIKEYASNKSLYGSCVKLVVLDEADSMTKDAQFALRRVIEKYSSSTRFCFIGNFVGKIIPALQSRCMKFRFAPLGPEQITDKVNEVISKEKIEITPKGVEAVVKLGQGDMRRVLNLLQTSVMAHQKVDEDTVYLTAAAPLPKDIDFCVNSLLNDSVQKANREILHLAKENGYSIGDILTEVYLRISMLCMPQESMIFLMEALSDIEYRLSAGSSENSQLAALVGSFMKMRYQFKI